MWPMSIAVRALTSLDEGRRLPLNTAALHSGHGPRMHNRPSFSVDDVNAHTSRGSHGPRDCAPRSRCSPSSSTAPLAGAQGRPEGWGCTALTFHPAFIGHRGCRGQNHLVACREGERDRGVLLFVCTKRTRRQTNRGKGGRVEDQCKSGAVSAASRLAMWARRTASTVGCLQWMA